MADDDDIVKTLRDEARYEFDRENRPTGLSILLEDAADEIERLQQEIADAREHDLAPDR